MVADGDALEGRHIDDKYVIGPRLGAGGMGVVYAAEQPALGRTVAIKLVRRELFGETNVLRRFRTEARAGSLLSHRNLVAVHDFATTDDGAPYLVMERVRGEPLAEVLAACGPLPVRRAVSLVGQVLAGLGEAHGAGIVHGDVKTDNVIVEHTRDGSELVKVIDFGLARFLDDPPFAAPSERVLSGTPEYLAPEVILGAAPTPASDVYGAGVILYELLAGCTPFGGGTTAEILSRHLDEDVVPPSLRNPECAIPAALERIMLRALAKEPLERYVDATAFALALAAVPAYDEPLAQHATCSAFSTEATTREMQLPPIVRARRRLAAGTRPSESEAASALRRELGSAITSGAVDAIVAGYLQLARALVDEHRLASAASELEEAVDLLTHGQGPAAADAPEPAWRILLALAAIYAGLGDPIRARKVAVVAHDLAARNCSDIGAERAHALIERFARRT
jgi:serine/threonine protein kinase